MDFDPVPGLVINGHRIASIDLLTPASTSGDAYLVCPDGRTIDLAWRSERSEPSARWSPPRLPDSFGVITVAIIEQVQAESDLGPVLEAAVTLIEPILATGIDLPQ